MSSFALHNRMRKSSMSQFALNAMTKFPIYMILTQRQLKIEETHLLANILKTKLKIDNNLKIA